LRAEPRRTAAGGRGDSDVVAKSYRYLRTAMVGLLVGLAVAVIYQVWRQDGDLLGSVSAYYYTPAQAIFVGALIGLGACMIALKGTTTVEDIFLNLGGVFAAVVAIVPTARDADHRAAVRACQEADTSLLTDRASTDPDCPTVRALADATKANVDNNLSTLLIVGALALLVTVLFALRDRRSNPEADRDQAYAWGFAAASALWLAVLMARLMSLQWVVDNAHFLAAAGLFGCLLVVAVANSRRLEDRPRNTPRVTQSAEAVRELVSVMGYHDRYIWIARIMLVVAAVSGALMVADLITLFWFEFAVAGIFIVFWTVQTVELEMRA